MMSTHSFWPVIILLWVCGLAVYLLIEHVPSRFWTSQRFQPLRVILYLCLFCIVCYQIWLIYGIIVRAALTVFGAFAEIIRQKTT